MSSRNLNNSSKNLKVNYHRILPGRKKQNLGTFRLSLYSKDMTVLWVDSTLCLNFSVQPSSSKNLKKLRLGDSGGRCSQSMSRKYLKSSRNFTGYLATEPTTASIPMTSCFWRIMKSLTDRFSVWTGSSELFLVEHLTIAPRLSPLSSCCMFLAPWQRGNWYLRNYQTKCQRSSIIWSRKWMRQKQYFINKKKESGKYLKYIYDSMERIKR